MMQKPNSQDTPIGNVMVSGAEGATLLGISQMRVSQLEREGVFQRAAGGKFQLGDLVIAYVRYLRDDVRRRSKTAGETRVQIARARQFELRNAREERLLIAIDEADESMAIVCGAVRTEFGSLAARCTRDLLLRRAIDFEVNGCLTRICAELEAQSKRLKEGERKRAKGKAAA
jgi:hypothetical protein